MHEMRLQTLFLYVSMYVTAVAKAERQALFYFGHLNENRDRDHDCDCDRDGIILNKRIMM
jgi:hypothetical protein